MEPLFSALIVGLVPQPTQMPAAPFEREALQKVFFEVSRDYPYSQFGLLPGDQGAQLLNPPDDRVLLQTQLLQVQSPLGTDQNGTTAERARTKTVSVLRTASERLGITQFLASGIKVTANVPAPPGGARHFVATQLFSAADRIDDTLGPDFFGGGIKVFRFGQDDGKVEILLVEPLLVNDEFIYVDYDIQRNAPFAGVDELGAWIDGALSFTRDRAMTFLEEASG